MNQLYHYPLSPTCRKLRLVLAEKKIEVELIEERYWEKANDAEFLRRNPAGQVPILRLEGQHMSGSQAICEYLEEKIPNPPLMPKTSGGRYEVRRLVGWFDDKFHREVGRKLLGERVLRKIQNGGYPDSKNVKAGASAMKGHLAYMANLLDHRRWLAGDTITLADFTAAAHISCLDYVSDVDWNYSANVKNWYATLKSRPAFRSILADHIPGYPQPRHYADLDF